MIRSFLLRGIPSAGLPLAALLVSASLAPAQQPAPAASPRLVFNLNQNWEFHRPAESPPFTPPADREIGHGEFPQGTAAQTVKLGKQSARYLCLMATSSYSGEYASVADFALMDDQGKALPRTGWRIVHASSAELSAGNLPAAAIDDDPKTFWHSAWKSKAPPPHTLVIDLGRTTEFHGFRYVPRPDGNSSGMTKAWKLFGSPTPFDLPASSSESPLEGKVAWEKVNLPHSVRLEPLNASGGRNYQGVCWYRKTLNPDPTWAGKTVLLHFEGAMQVADVWLDGQKLTTHFGGYQPFVIDLTGKLTTGKPNLLLVRLDNSDNPEVPPGKPQNTLDFTYFGGLYRDVRLEVADPLHITDEVLANKIAGGGILVTYPQVSAEKAVVKIQTDIANDSQNPRRFVLRQDLLDATGAVVAIANQNADLPAKVGLSVVQSLEVTKPKLWHPLHPDLYSLHTTVLSDGKPVDARVTRLGLRRIEFKPEGMWINGEKFCALGVNRHQDHPYVGYALPNSQHYRDAKKLRDAGFTSFRSHYPQDPAFLEACDELGIVCVISNPGWQFFGDQTWQERTFQNAKEMVRRDRNHACAVIWEPFPNETQYPESYARRLHDIVHEELPGDQCFTAGDPEIGHAGKFIDVAWSRDPVAGKPFWGREWGDSVDNWGDQQGRVRVARGWGETPLITQAVNHAIKLDAMLKAAGGGPATTKLAGAGLWAGIDCYRGYHHQPFYGGPLDLFRLPKFSYYFFQSQRPPTVTVPGVESGPMVFIANYASCYSPATVTVFSNCEEVRFSENGKVVATQKPDAGYVIEHPPFTFKAKAANAEKSTYYMTNDNAANSEAGYHYEASEYKAEGLIGGKVVATQSVKAPGVMRKIVLEVDESGRGLTADGADWIRVYAKVCDGRGTVHPFSNNLITFTIEGEGSLIGDASVGANPVAAEAGIATALVRASAKPGKITVKATSFGLENAETTIESKVSADRFR